MDSNKQGFTLVEVLVALTLFGLIATTVAVATRLGTDISRRGNRQVDVARTTALQRRILDYQLRGALPFRYWTRTGDNRIEHVGFEGAADHLRFVSRYGVFDAWSLPRWIEIRTSPSSRVVIEEHRILSPDNLPGNITASSEVLNCADVEFQYLAVNDKGPLWVSTWNEAEQMTPLPAAVRFRCGAAQGGFTSLIPLDYSNSAREGLRFQ